ncbi:MAG: TolC family protein [Ignavibacteriae bacterium]|nr:TolC family protein [Ignavibacteriota bacterium]
MKLKENKMYKLSLFCVFLFCSINAFAQNDVLEEYIGVGLQNNLALKQKEFSLKRSIAELREAKGMFLPSVGINARYSRADGGREFEIPVGDLVNPIYSAINQLSGSNNFPTNIPNERINFFRKKEHDTKISLVQPIFQPKILFNYKIISRLSDVEKAKRNIYARSLVADIKKSYYNYLSAIETVKLFEETEKLLLENLRVSESLFNNQKVTEDVVFRANAELSELQQQKAGAEKNEYMAASYFNFLLNRPLDEKIKIVIESKENDENLPHIETYTEFAKINREEFYQLDRAIEAAEYSIDLSKSDFLPGVALAFDYGFQGEEYKFNSDNDYWMASVVLNWNLFNGFRDAAKVSQAKYQKSELEAKKNEAAKQISLEVREAYQNVVVSLKSYAAAEDRLESVSKAFKIIERKYREGLVNQIEFLDARTTLTQAGINKIITGNKLFVNKAELERVAALYQIEFD